MYPPLRAWLFFSFTILSTVIVILIIIPLIHGLKENRMDFPSWEKLRLGATIVLVVGTGLGVLLFGLGWITATTADEKGLHGGFWVLRTTIGWDEIASVQRVTDNHGIPFLVIRSRVSKKQLRLCVLGLEKSSLLERLQAFILSDHGEPEEKSG
jgi:hypothetical protein